MILDTSVLIAAERGQIDLAELLEGRPQEPVVISAVTAAELLHGVERADSPRRRAGRAAFVEWVFVNVRVLPFGLDEARTHGRLSAALAEAGTPVGAHDLLLAATAIAHGEKLATRDLRSFPRVPGLTWEKV